MSSLPQSDVQSSDEPPVLLVSSREPSGVSWIINCLLELGIRVDLQPTVDQIFGVGRQPASAMWLPESNGRWRLHPRASALQKWLPFLSREETYVFRSIPPVLHVQRLPLRHEKHRQVILFVRDLRDALHSLYRRLQPELSWEEFIDWPHPETLLNAIDHWRLFMECWLDQSALFVGRFEDYKADATDLLSRVLHAMHLDFPAEAIALAAERSSYTAAAAAEARYRQTHPQDQQVVNRAGLVGEWQSLANLQPTMTAIEQRAGQLLTRLGYAVSSNTAPRDPWDTAAVARQLSSFATFFIPERLLNEIPNAPSKSHLVRLRDFIARSTADRLTQSRLEVDEIRTLLRHLEEFSHQHVPAATESLQALRETFAEGSSFHMARIRALFLSRRTDSAT